MAWNRKIFAGYVGQALAEEFEAFWRVYSNMVSFDDIVSNLMTAKNSGSVFSYLARLPTEYQIIVAQTATKRDPSLKIAKGYTDWAVRNSHVII
jgi:hypothetical protein